MAGAERLLDIKGLKTYFYTEEGVVRAVDGIDLHIDRGETLGVVGESGCGKTVTALSIMKLIARARRLRKMLGGGMRQAGVIAAAGIVALEGMVDRLVEDHANARALAEGVARLPRVRVDLASVQTNIVIVEVERPDGAGLLVEGCRARKVKIHAVGPRAIRCVTHKDVDGEDIERALAAVCEITAGW